MDNVDIYVHSDTMQYMRHSWVNRNRILTNNGEWKYIIVPIKKQEFTARINEIKIDYGQNWQNRILSQISIYKKSAPFYTEVSELVSKVIESKYDNIADLNIASVKSVLDYLGIEKNIYRLSKLNVDSSNVREPDDWGVVVSKYFDNVTEYWNAPGGKEFYNVDKYHNNNLQISFINTQLVPYTQLRGTSFVPGLSIIDVMMYNSPDIIRQMLQKFSLK